MGKNKPQQPSLARSLAVPILVALLVGGSSPWWWEKAFGSKPTPAQPPTISISLPAPSPVPTPAPPPPSPGASYIPVWQCVPAALRPQDVALESTKPDASHLDSGLLWASFADEAGCAQRLIDAGANVNAYQVPATGGFMDGPPLHVALNWGNWSMARMLLNNGADPKLTTSHMDRTALQIAVNANAPDEVIQMLKEEGAK